jgi:hypothetical protein
LLPILDDFLDTYPAVSANLYLLDRIVNLIDEGIVVHAGLCRQQRARGGRLGRRGARRDAGVLLSSRRARTGRPAPDPAEVGRARTLAGSCVTPQGWLSIPKVRAFVDFVVPRLRVKFARFAADAGL